MAKSLKGLKISEALARTLFALAIFVLRKFKLNPILVMVMCGVIELVTFIIYKLFMHIANYITVETKS